MMRIARLFFIVAMLVFQFTLQSNDEVINFHRRQKPGASYLATISTEHSVTCKLKGANSEKDIKNVQKFEFDGRLVVLACDADGAATEILLSSHFISGTVNNDNSFFKRGYEEFNLKWDTQRMRIETKDKDFSASPQEIELLSLIFRPPSSQAKLEDILGEEHKFKLDEEWAPPKNYIKKIFSSRGLSINDENILQKARFKGKSAESVGECVVVFVNMNIIGIEGFDFNYEAEIVLPINENCVPCMTKSKSVEKILKKNLDKADPGLVGKDIDEMLITITDAMNVSLKAEK